MSRRKVSQAKLERKARKSAKKDRRESQRRRELQPSYSLLSGLDEAEELLKEGNLDDAVEVLEELRRRYPRRLEVLGMLLEPYVRQHDMWSYQAVCQRILELDPEDQDVWLSLAGAATANGQLSTAHRAFDHYLNHWPDSEFAANARETRDQLAAFFHSEIAKRGVSEAEGFELFSLHDEVNFRLHQGEYDKVCETAERLLRRWPTFAPALNNRCEAQFRLGRLDLAVADARRVLEFDAENFHALANLARFLVLAGRPEEAAEVAQRLKAVDSSSNDLFVKKAEALSFLGDWSGVLETLQQAQRCDNLDDGTDGLLYHLAGVAAANLDQLDIARKHWKRAIKLKSADTWAQQNLDDSKLPVGEQNGPWAYPIDYWIPTAVIDRLTADMERAGPRAKDAEVRRRVRKFFEAHPYLERLMPQLLEHGEPSAQEFVVRIAPLAELPSIYAALQDFAFGQRGSDDLRSRAANRLVNAGEVPRGPQRMWCRGEWRDLLLMNYEISGEPSGHLPPEVERLAARAQEALENEDAALAEALYNQTLQLCPGEPSLEYNRATAIELQNREDEALALVRDLHARHPDYLFARVRLARKAVKDRDFVAARALLAPLLERSRFHVTEYSVFCMAHVELFLAEGQWEGARTWLKMWRDVNPDDPKLKVFARRLIGPRLLGKFVPRR